jgi:tetratricopeptide (TPR) repeat protein
MNVHRISARIVTAVGLLTIVAHARAQTPVSAESTAAPASLDNEAQWRTLFAQARSAFAAERLVEAKGLLLKAGEIRMTPKIVASLAQVELQLGEYRAAANHAAAALVELGNNAGVEADLAEAAKHVGKLSVAANLPFARVTLDGEVIGVTPLARATYVDPGMHIVGIDKPGYARMVREVTAAAASQQDIVFELAPETPAAPLAQPHQTNVAQHSATCTAPAAPRSAIDDEPRSSAFRTVALIAGGALAAAGVTTGFVLNAKAQRSERAANTLSRELGTDGCVAPSGSHSNECERLIDERRNHDRAQNLSTAGFAVAGAATAALVAVVFWPRSTNVTPLQVEAAGIPGAGFVSIRGHY